MIPLKLLGHYPVDNCSKIRLCREGKKGKNSPLESGIAINVPGQRYIAIAKFT